MSESFLSCILNPVRMRIMQSLINNNSMTVQQIAKELPDVPQATLYRHLNKLVQAKAITVVKENKIRGASEKVYAVETNPYETIAKGMNSKEQYLNLFYNFLMILLGDFEGYISSNDANLEKDGVTFRSGAMYLSDEEFIEFLKDLAKAFDKVRENGPMDGRRLRKISTIIMPGVNDINKWEE